MDKFEKKVKIELYNDHFENAKRYQIPRAQLIIADIPYNIGINAYGSRSDWYVGGDNKNGESDKAGKEIGRRFLGFELDKNYYKVSIDRLNGIDKNGQMSIFTDFENV